MLQFCKKVIFGFILSFNATLGLAQELFVMTEPASNMPASSLGIRLSNAMMKEQFKSGYNYHLMPEVMVGLDKNLMLHALPFFSNRNQNLVFEGASVYAKYRFFSIDDLHQHFRTAVFARYSKNNSDIHQEEIETMGHNSGFETGIIATQLINKLAISTTVSFEKATDNQPNYQFPSEFGNQAINYSLSFGKLVYPKKYSNFKQTNINLMFEFLGQSVLENQKSFLDAVPSLQLIINSQARIDIAYRKQLYSSMLRTAYDGFYLKLEYTFFNAL